MGVYGVVLNCYMFIYSYVAITLCTVLSLVHNNYDDNPLFRIVRNARLDSGSNRVFPNGNLRYERLSSYRHVNQALWLVCT